MLPNALLLIILVSLISTSVCSPVDKPNNLPIGVGDLSENSNTKLNLLKKIFKRDCYSDGYSYCDCGCCGDEYNDCNECGSCCGC